MYAAERRSQLEATEKEIDDLNRQVANADDEGDEKKAAGLRDRLNAAKRAFTALKQSGDDEEEGAEEEGAEEEGAEEEGAEEEAAPDATPAAVEAAVESGVDLSEIEGSGQEGRILKGDVEAAAPTEDDGA